MQLTASLSTLHCWTRTTTLVSLNPTIRQMIAANLGSCWRRPKWSHSRKPSIRKSYDQRALARSWPSRQPTALDSDTVLCWTRGWQLAGLEPPDSPSNISGRQASCSAPRQSPRWWYRTQRHAVEQGRYWRLRRLGHPRKSWMELLEYAPIFLQGKHLGVAGDLMLTQSDAE
jgi:hypothetical protein